MDRSFVAQLNDYRITTAEILYWMPDHRHVLQSYVWQNLDLAPRQYTQEAAPVMPGGATTRIVDLVDVAADLVESLDVLGMLAEREFDLGLLENGVESDVEFDTV